MKRREFIAGLGGAAAAWPLVARAQPRPTPVIGYISARSMDADAPIINFFRTQFNEIGLIEGRTVGFEFRFAEYRLERLPALAAGLVSRQVTVIFAVPTPAASAAKAATKSIPIVFAVGVDPVQSGLVASLARPGGNLTGVYTLNVAVAAKRLELLHELLPAAKSIAFLRNPANAAFTPVETEELETAARSLKLGLLLVNAGDPSEFEPAFEILSRERVGGLVVSSESLFISNPGRLAALAAYRVPAVHPSRGAPAAGGLMSYGAETTGLRVIFTYIGRILKGERPSDLPVQQYTGIELVINQQAAKALGLTFPTALLVRADEVIE
jgi:putative tryptophan/tyrosine transport system substrate-binding protein